MSKKVQDFKTMKKKQSCVCIIMSTYNGEKYIKEQLESIKGQTCNEKIILYVRDDGSSDTTISLLEEYRDKNEMDITIAEGENVGASKSFLCAIRECPDAEYYAFCDQDDVWKKDKLQTAINAIGDTERPVLWCSNYEVVDQNLNTLSMDGLKKPRTNSLELLFYNNVPGCVMVFNRALMELLRKINIEEIRMHDIMAINIAALTGTILYESKPLILYRQHGNNAIGYGNRKIEWKKWLPKKIKLVLQGEKYSTYEYAERVVESFSSNMSEEEKREYKLIGRCKKNIISRIILLNRPYTKIKLGRTSRAIRLRILLGRV